MPEYELRAVGYPRREETGGTTGTPPAENCPIAGGDGVQGILTRLTDKI